jgi:hypothetical protein
MSSVGKAWRRNTASKANELTANKIVDNKSGSAVDVDDDFYNLVLISVVERKGGRRFF